MIVLENITKIYKSNNQKKELHAVNDVSLKINKGEIYGIIGFSGAGKSTLVRCINLLERPTYGKVFVEGVELTSIKPKNLREKRKKIGMIFQQFNLFASRTVYENVAYPLKGMPKDMIEDKVMYLLDLVGIKDKANSYPSQLSGGQKQRVAIARALANEPNILLCDEATSALDPKTTHSILELLKKLNKTLGITIVIITHEMTVVKEICNRIAVMSNGQKIEEGNIFDIFSNPTHKVTKDFIDTTSNVSKIYSLVEEDNELTKINDNESILRLKYKRDSVIEPLVSKISRDLNVDVNILFANIELVNDTHFGGLVVKMTQIEKGGIDKAIEFLKDRNVDVEVIVDARNTK